MTKENPDNRKREIQTSDNAINKFIFSPFWKRLAAWLLDSLILLAIVAILLYFLKPNMLTIISESQEITIEAQRYLSLMFQTFVILNLIYYTLLEGSIGQTIGKKVLGIKVYKENGEKIGFSYALIRRIGMIVPFLNLIDGASILFTQKNQRIFDIVASTNVINSKNEEDAVQFLKGKGLNSNLREKIEDSRGNKAQGVNKEKILANLKEKKNDLEKRYEQDELEESDYQNIKSKYETRIRDLEKELNTEN